METLVGWGLLILVILLLVFIIKVAGSPGKAQPHCGVAGEGKSGGCCH